MHSSVIESSGIVQRRDAAAASEPASATAQSAQAVHAAQIAQATQVAWMRRELHDLAQPLTALECVLYLGTLEPEGGDQAALRRTIDDALVQCGRLMGGVRAIQESLQG